MDLELLVKEMTVVLEIMEAQVQEEAAVELEHLEQMLHLQQLQAQVEMDLQLTLHGDWQPQLDKM